MNSPISKACSAYTILCPPEKSSVFLTGPSIGSCEVIPSKWNRPRSPQLSFDTIYILLHYVIPLGRSGVCAVKVSLLTESPVHPNSNCS